MNYPRYCPACDDDMQGTLIPEDMRDAYGHATHFSRWMAQCSQDTDRCIGITCPSCGHAISTEKLDKNAERAARRRAERKRK